MSKELSVNNGLFSKYVSIYYAAKKMPKGNDYKKRKEQANLMGTLYQWNDNLREGKYIYDYLINNGYINVSIYGFGELGFQLFKEIHNSSGVKILSFIDREEKNDYYGIKCLALNNPEITEVLKQSDIIIVTPINDTLGIKKNINIVLNEKHIDKHIEVLSIEEIIFDM